MESYTSHDIPDEVKAVLLSLGLAELKKCELIKVSFHATYILEFAGPPREKAVLQLIGSQLGDKALFRRDRPISTASIEKGSALAREAGIRVPDVLATGMVDRWGTMADIPFIVYEFIATETVEDKVIAPGPELSRIIGDIRKSLEARPLTGVDTEPIQRFDDVAEFIKCLKELAAEIDAADLNAALDEISKEFAAVTPVPPVLIHQDLNDGNTLCSRDARGSGSWHLDALIDWEGVAVADPRLAWSREEPWRSLRDLSLLTRCRWLVGVAAKGGAAKESLPRCALEELLEDYKEIGERG